MNKLSNSEINKLKKMNFYNKFKIYNFTTNGIYNWEPYLNYFKKINLKNKSLLDVGPGDGFFSRFFLEQKCKVSAYEIKDQKHRDNFNYGHLNIIKKISDQGKKITKNNTGSFLFNYANKLLKKNIKIQYGNIYDLGKIKKKYDIVFCNDVLLHLTDPFRGLVNLKLASKKIVIFSSPIIAPNYKNSNFIKASIYGIILKLIEFFPIAFFFGHTDKLAFWIPNKSCLEAQVRAAGLKIIKSYIITPSIEDLLSHRPRCIIYCKV
jgi:2-polyprenyl-3-methyl-5-hydroxy-6-metoxy-1,4-benzoquinol methylase